VQDQGFNAAPKNQASIVIRAQFFPIQTFDLPDTAAPILRKRDLGIGSLSARLLCLNDLDRFVELEG
jgi:hypothetical protein